MLLRELVDHLGRTTALGPSQAERVVAEVVGFFDETTDELVQRRHRELQREGLGNDEIFVRIGQELEQWRVRAPQLSARQLRRMVYG
jgi:hypothetical protein